MAHRCHLRDIGPAHRLRNVLHRSPRPAAYRPAAHHSNGVGGGGQHNRAGGTEPGTLIRIACRRPAIEVTRMVSPSPSRTAAMRALVSASRPAVCCQSARTRSARPERTSMMQGHAVRVSRRGEHPADRQHSAPARRPAVDTMSWIGMVCPQVARSVAPRPRHSRTCDATDVTHGDDRSRGSATDTTA
jgi:hypothetical protein